MGPSWANITRLRYVAEWVSSKAKAPRVTFCIHVPTLEAMAPNHTTRKSRDASAARAELISMGP
jgi:hypothetical protein